jgi:hypothetical protein
MRIACLQMLEYSSARFRGQATTCHPTLVNKESSTTFRGAQHERGNGIITLDELVSLMSLTRGG